MKRKSKEEIIKEREIGALVLEQKQASRKIVITSVLLALTYISFLVVIISLSLVGPVWAIFMAVYLVLNTINSLINGRMYQVTSAMSDGATETLKGAMKKDKPLQSTSQRVETKIEYGAAIGAGIATWVVYLFYMFFGFIFGIRGIKNSKKFIEESRKKLEELQSN